MSLGTSLTFTVAGMHCRFCLRHPGQAVYTIARLTET